MQTNNSSCADLIFTDQPNLSVSTGVYASLNPNCHYKILVLTLIFDTLSAAMPMPNRGLKNDWFN